MYNKNNPVAQYDEKKESFLAKIISSVSLFNSTSFIKRVIGLPGEEVTYRDNSLYIDGHEIENDYNFETEDFTLKDICNCDYIPEGKYLVLGDNRGVSADSRIMGFIDREDIQGSVEVSLWPIKIVK